MTDKSTTAPFLQEPEIASPAPSPGLPKIPLSCLYWRGHSALPMAGLQEPLLILSPPQAAVGTEVLGSQSSCPDAAGPHSILRPSQQGGSVFTCCDHSPLSLMLVTCTAHLHGHLKHSPWVLCFFPGLTSISDLCTCHCCFICCCIPGSQI